MIAESQVRAHGPAQADRPLHVLTLTPFYPVGDDDGQGCFVAEPLRCTEALGVANTALAVRPFYMGPAVTGNSAASQHWTRFFSLPSGFGLPTSGALLFARIVSQVRRLHRSRPLHLIHAHSALPCGHAAALLSRELGVPFVVTVHGLDAFFTRQVSGYAGRLCARVSRFVYRSAKGVICISEKVRDQVERGLESPASTAVIYNGVDPHQFSPAGEEPVPATILSVGNLIAIKGHEHLLRALATVRKHRPSVRCEIIGDGPERSSLQRLATELGLAENVRFLGRQRRTQVAEAMRRCTMFVLPSRYEALGCVYLEAMCSGKAVVACRGQGIEEVIQQGTNGWLVDAGDAPGLANSLTVLLQQPDLRRRMGKAARRTILQGLTLEHQTARLVRLYRECVA